MEKGDVDALKKYSFERRNGVYRVSNCPFQHHRPDSCFANERQFCGICGTNVFVKDPEEIGINVIPHERVDGHSDVGIYANNPRRGRSKTST